MLIACGLAVSTLLACSSGWAFARPSSSTTPPAPPAASGNAAVPVPAAPSPWSLNALRNRRQATAGGQATPAPSANPATSPQSSPGNALPSSNAPQAASTAAPAPAVRIIVPAASPSIPPSSSTPPAPPSTTGGIPLPPNTNPLPPSTPTPPQTHGGNPPGDPTPPTPPVPPATPPAPPADPDPAGGPLPPGTSTPPIPPDPTPLPPGGGIGGGGPIIHSFTSLPLDANGFSMLTPSSDSRILYVSSSTGNDANDGLSPQRAKRTLSAAYEHLRDGYPDHMLLLSTDTWNTGLPLLGSSGRSSTERQVIGAYGPAGSRPRLNCWSGVSRGGGSVADVRHVAIVGLHFVATGRDGSNGGGEGIRLIGKTHDLLFEDNKLEGFLNNINVNKFDRDQSRTIFRRNIIVDGWSNGSHSQGIYADGIEGLWIEENFLDRNGWNPAVPNAVQTIFNHGMYLQGSNSDVTVKGNISARNAATGIQLRGAGLVEGNLVINSPLGITLGHQQSARPNGFVAIARDNLVYDGGDIGDAPRSFGIGVSNLSFATLENNVVMNNTSGSSQGYPIWIEGAGQGVLNLTIRSNRIYNWNGPIQFATGPHLLPSITLTGNTVVHTIAAPVVEHVDPGTLTTTTASRNQWFTTATPGQWVRNGSALVDLPWWLGQVNDQGSVALPSRPTVTTPTLEEHAGSILGTATRDAFFQAHRQRPRGTWDHRLSAAGVRAAVAPNLPALP
jgi:hypothetical protein